MNSKIYEYNSSGKQPDPEIWGGGVAGGPLTFNSGSEYSEKISYQYSLESSPGFSAIGLIITSSSGNVDVIKNYIGSTIIFNFSNEKLEGVVYNPPESLCELQVTGSSSSLLIKQETLSPVELESSGICIEKITYDYNLESIVGFSSENNGQVDENATQIESYGNIFDVVNDGQQDYGSTEISQTTSSSIGTISLFGSAVQIQNSFQLFFGNIFIDGGSSEKVTYNPPESLLQLQLLGSAATEFVSYNPPEETINLELIVTSTEKISYDYNEDSDNPLVSDSYELITNSPTEVFDYGLILNEITSGSEDFDLIVFNSVEPFGSIGLTGSALIVPPIDIGIYNITANYSVVYNPPENTATLFNVGNNIESVSYDYNLDSRVVESQEDFGTVSVSAVDFDNYGILSDEPIEFRNYQTLAEVGGLNPFGSLTLNGSAITEYTNVNFYAPEAQVKVVYSPDDTSGTLFSFGEKVESITYDYNLESTFEFTNINYGFISVLATEFEDIGLVTEISSQVETYGSFDISSTLTPFGSLTLNGSATTEYIDINFYAVKADIKVVYSPDDTSGTLFSFGEKVESITYDYNENSIFIAGDTNYGSISDVYTDSENHETITEIHSITDDFGFIVGPSVSADLYPFGSIVVSGFGSEVLESQTPENEIIINLNGTLVEKTTHVPPINISEYLWSSSEKTFDSSEDTFDTSKIANILLSGSSGDSPVIYSEIGSGSLFNIGYLDESVTYDYTKDSILTLINENSGLIINTATSLIDYGLITETYTGEDDNGLISNNDTLTPFGSLIFTGSAVTEWVNLNIYGDEPTAQVKIVRSPDNTTGTLFSSGEKSEAISYDYNENSILIVGETDYESIASIHTTESDYGSIGEIHSQTEDQGFIIGFSASSDVLPFGTLIVSGSSVASYIQNIIFTGVIFISGSATIDFTPEFTSEGGPLNVSGLADAVFVSVDPTSGTLIGSGTLIERRTRSYNESSILTINEQIFDYGSVSVATTQLSGDYGFVSEIENENTEESGFIYDNPSILYPFGTITISGTPLVYPEVDYTPKYTGSGFITISGTALESETDAFGVGRRRGGTIAFYGDALYSETDSYIGFGTIFISDAALESDQETYVGSGTIVLSGQSSEVYSPNPPENDISIIISGSAIEKNTESYVGIGNVQISGSILESETDSYVGLGTIFVSDTALEKDAEVYVGFGTIFISDAALESDQETYVGFGTILLSGTCLELFSAQIPADTQLFTFSGELNHPQIDYTPHYGIEKNIGVGTTGIQISGVVDDSAQRIARGTGSISVVNGFSPQESYPWLPGAGVGRSWSYVRSTYIAEGTLNISSGIALTNYYSPIYPRNSDVPGSGIGTIRINDDKQITFYRATLPVSAKGTIYILGVGTAANGDLDGVEIGANESFTPSTEIGTGLFRITGISSNRQIDVFQGYQTDGLITISQQTSPIVERYTSSYLGIGTIFISQTLVEKNTESYVGLGSIFGLSGDSESYSAQTPEETVTITISGSAQESFIAQSPENTILYQFSGAVTDEKLVKSYFGSGSHIFAGSANVNFSAAHEGNGTFRFVNYKSDNIYDTCDSSDITSDYVQSAGVSFVANTPENTILFEIGGNAVTTETALYTKIATGVFTLSGTYQNIKLTHSESGIGTIFVAESSSESEADVYVGFGTLFTLSGKSESYSAQTPEGTVVLQISGSATTLVEFEYQIVGVGLFNFNGVAVTSEIATYTQVGLGVISISGELTHPNIDFVPSPDGFGTINILGSSNESIVRIYDDTSGNLFAFSSGLESFAKSTYLGIGTIYVQSSSASVTNNPFQIPRTYVCII